MDFNKIGEYLEKIPQFEEFRENEKVKSMIGKYSEGDVYDKFNEISERKHRDIVTAQSEGELELIDISKEMFIRVLELTFPIEDSSRDILEPDEKEALLSMKRELFKSERKSFMEMLPEITEKRKELNSRYKRVINCLGVVKSEYIGKDIYSEEILDEFKAIYSRYTNFRFNEEKGEKRELDSEIEKILKGKFGDREFILTNSAASAAYLLFDTISRGKKVIMGAGDNIAFEDEKCGIADAVLKAGADLKIVGYHNSIKSEDYLKEINYDSETAIYGEFIENSDRKNDLKRAEAFDGIKDKVKTVYIGNRIISGNGISSLMSNGIYANSVFLKEYNGYILDFSKIEGFPPVGVISADKPIMKKIKDNILSEFVKAGESDRTLFYLCCLEKILSNKIDERKMDIESVEKRNLFFMGKLKYETGDKVEVEKIPGNYLSITDNIPEELKLKTELVSVKINKKTAAEVEKELRNADPIVLCWLNDDTLIFNLALADDSDIEHIVKIAAAKIKKSRYIKKGIDKQ